MNTTCNAKRIFTGAVSFVLLIVLDQLTKYMAVTSLKGAPAIDIIKHVFSLQYLENHGAAFGMLKDQQWFFLLLALTFLVIAAILYVRIPFTHRMLPLRIVLIFLAAGAVGNMIDRLLYHYVIDFFYFNLIDFPIFNVADIYITVSAFAVVIMILFIYKDEDFAFLSKKKGD